MDYAEKPKAPQGGLGIDRAVDVPSGGKNYAPIPEMLEYLTSQLAETNDLVYKLQARLSPVLVAYGPSEEEMAMPGPDGRAPIADSIDTALRWNVELQNNINRIIHHLQL